MMKNKTVCIILTLLIMFMMFIVLIVVTFSGCQLAHEDLAQIKENDRLIGVFVSYEHLDLFDMESYLNDNASKFFSGGNNIEISDVDEKYNNRLYATLMEKEMTAIGGEKYTYSDYIFEGIDGISMFAFTSTDPITGNRCTSSISGDGISDHKYHIKRGDNGEGIELEGSIFVASGAMSDAIYINPVYQSEGGKVYLQSGQGFMASSDNDEGGVYTQTMTDSTSRTENKMTTTYTASIKLSIATMNSTEKVAIYQMDSANSIIEKNEYLPNGVPDKITPNKSCEYFIVESHKIAFDGKKQVERQIFSRTDTSLYYFVKGSNGVLYKTHSSIIWETKDNV